MLVRLFVTTPLTPNIYKTPRYYHLKRRAYMTGDTSTVLFYIQVSFIVTSLILLLIYVFISMFMKHTYRQLNDHIAKTRSAEKRIDQKIDQLLRRR